MRRATPNGGAALLYAMGLTGILGIMAGTVWTSLLRETNEAQRAGRHAIVRQLAEAGIEHAMARAGFPLEEGKEYPLGMGFYKVALEQGEAGQALRVHSTGMLKDGERVTYKADLYAELASGYRLLKESRP